MGAILKLVFGISEAETTFERRGFRGGTGGMREHLEKIGRAFVGGYHAALETSEGSVLVPRLEQFDLEYRGFAYEGAAMGLGILDRVTPWRRNRVEEFLKGAGAAHTYMVHVALGWVFARLPGRIENVWKTLDPLLRWLVIDGYGFHEGFFHWRKYIHGAEAPPRLQGYARSVFDQGFGRSLWFIEGGDVERIPQTISRFAPERRAHLWSGIGLASAYAGIASEDQLRALRVSAGEHWVALAQGAAFAAKARQRAGNLMYYTERACRVLCERSADEAARLTDEALENLPPNYELWRQRIQDRLAAPCRIETLK